MSGDFEDIVIVDLDLSRTTWSRVHASMRTLYLRLNREPDTEWTRFFHQERESRIMVNRHGLWIEDGCIVFDCLLSDVETHHLPDFRQSVEYANAKCRELAETRREQGEQLREDARGEQLTLAVLQARIRSQGGISAAPSAKAAGAETEAGGFSARRDEWRARFRTALANRNKESDRGND
jgi:hypothetical protein